MRPVGTSVPDTFPKLLLEHAQQRGTRPAYREKDLGIWQTWTWSETKEAILRLAAGMKSMGLRRGDAVAIVGDNRPHLYWAIVAAQAVGALPVPLYQDSVAEEMIHVLTNADVRFAVVEDQEQTDKMLEIRDRCPMLEAVIYNDSRGMRHYDQPILHLYENVQEKGAAYLREHPGELEADIAQGKSEDIAILLYTSGTTGLPKGVSLSFGNLIFSGEVGRDFDQLTDQEETLAYLPMAWVGDNVFSIGQAYVAGFCVNCPESPETVLTDLREIGPTYYFAPPSVYERMLTQVMIRIEDAGALKQWLFNTFMAVARRCGTDILDGKSVSASDRLLYALGELCVYGPLKNVLGLSRTRVAYTAGEAIGPELFAFFRSLGINIKQLYGQTEASVFICAQPNGQVRSDTVGPPTPGVEVRIDDSGEVFYRSPGVFQAYHKNPEATSKTKSEDNWVATGDAGFFDNEGHLKIIDRVKDVGRMSDNSLFAPKYIENKLKFFAFIKHVVCFGDGREYATAFINIDLNAVGNWAERRGLAYSGFTDLSARTEVYDLIQECVESVNADLARDEKLRNSQIARFLLLHKELDADDGELTRTSKVRRNIIDERYGPLIAALYDPSQDHCQIEAQITFEDGRKGTIRADLAIRDCKRVTESVKAAA